MAWYPKAVRKEVKRFRRRMRKPVRINLHTAVSNASSLFGFFNRPGNVTSHFYVRKDGTVEQYVNTKYRAACDLKGNPDTVSIESWDGYGRVWKSGSPPEWTPEQVAAIAELVQWLWDTHGSIPKREATTSKRGRSSHGLSFHRLGVASSRSAYRRGVSQTGGMLYSTSVGKICPGPKRIAQVGEIFARAKGGEVAKPSGKPSKKPSSGSGGKGWPKTRLATTKAHTKASHAAWVKLMTDTGHMSKGESLTLGVQRWLKSLGFYKANLDGDWGPYTTDALQRFLKSKGLYRGRLDAFRVSYRKARGAMMIGAEIMYLNSQRQYY